jgi:hypothetical protein
MEVDEHGKAGLCAPECPCGAIEMVPAGIVYALQFGYSLHTWGPDGKTITDVVLTSQPNAGCGSPLLLVGGHAGHSAILVDSCGSPSVFTFVSDTDKDRLFPFDVDSDLLEVAPRDGTALVAFTRRAYSVSAVPALEVTEIAPSGARTRALGLGSFAVPARDVWLARAGDGSVYLVVAENVGERGAWLLRCGS